MQWKTAKSICPGAVDFNRCMFLLLVAVLLFLAVFAGCSKRDLDHPTPQTDADSQFWIRVLLLEDVNNCTIRSKTGLNIQDQNTQLPAEYFGYTDELLDVTIKGRTINIEGLSFAADSLTIIPNDPYILQINEHEFRGKLVLTISQDAKSFNVTNLVPLEPYLAGVVGAEMPNYWEPAALEAQAIAARTYCLYIKRRFGSNRSWDLKKNQAHQVYQGLQAETNQVWTAVNKTGGKVLTYKQKDGSRDIFPAYYSSICGGHTENAKNVFGGDDIEPLKGVDCPYCREVAKPKFFSWPAVEFDKVQASKKLLQNYPSLAKLGDVNEITISDQSTNGNSTRITSVKITGTNGKTDSLRAEDLRLTLDPSGTKFKSTMCQLEDRPESWVFSRGKGWGHGVGLCQCGAQAMARKGKKAKQILYYYYPSSKITEIY